MYAYEIDLYAYFKVMNWVLKTLGQSQWKKKLMKTKINLEHYVNVILIVLRFLQFLT